jgi:hypothetical protein
MANALMRDALARESGGLGSLTQNITPGTLGAAGAGSRLLERHLRVHLVAARTRRSWRGLPRRPITALYYPVGGGAPYGADVHDGGRHPDARYASITQTFDPRRARSVHR